MDAESMMSAFDARLLTLSSVRKPGKGKLSLAEAMETAIEQALAYEEWRRFGAPRGVIDVWVEAKKIMTVEPGEAADLKRVLFEFGSPAKSVVQVVRRADEFADTVVLLNGELKKAPPEGVRFMCLHPQNQEVALEVKPEANGLLSFGLEFNTAGPVEADGRKPVGRLKAKAAAARAALGGQLKRLELFGLPTVGAATAVLAFAVGVSVLRQAGVNAQESAAGRDARATHAQVAVAPLLSVASAVEPVAGEASEAASLVVELSAPAQNPAPAAAAAETASASAVARPRLKPEHVEVKASAEEPLIESESEMTAVITAQGVRRGAGAYVSPWDEQRLRRLAAIHSVFLRTEEGTRLEEAQLKELLASVHDALKKAGMTVVTDEGKRNTTDGTVSVRFVPDQTSFGALFVTMHDRDDNFLWQDYAGCRPPQGDGWGAVFDDVLARLISRLPQRTQNVGAQTQPEMSL